MTTVTTTYVKQGPHVYRPGKAPLYLPEGFAHALAGKKHL